MDTDAIAKRVARNVVAGSENPNMRDLEVERMEMAKELMKEFQSIEALMGKAITELKQEARGRETNLRDTGRAVGSVGGAYYSDATAYFFA